ncbi:MAG TPA: sulfite exporter TauE/SafE family protein, partial [Spirochaetia bacterium]|nr:sulfite exporter TauE/SafE family protein [Spirochaetia bacterium]
ATWVYINQAAILPLIAVPSVAGMMIGTRVGAELLPRVRAPIIRWIVIALMALAGMRSLVAGILGVFS